MIPELSIILRKIKTRRKILFPLFFCAVGLKLIYLLFSYSLREDKREFPIYQQYVNTVKNFDSFWYEKIYNEGYPTVSKKSDLGYSEGAFSKQSTWAFFPLYPALLGCFKGFLNFNDSAFVISLIFSFLSIYLLYKFGQLYYNSEPAALNVFIFYCFPFSFYFSMFYSESIYLSLILLSFLLIESNKISVLFFVLIPLVLIRPNGIVVTIPLYIFLLEKMEIISKSRIKFNRLLERKTLVNSLAFLSAPITFLAYCFFNYYKTGFFFAFSIAQDGWYRELSWPWMSLFKRGDFATQFNSIYSILIVGIAFIFRKKFPLSLTVFIWLSLLLPLCSGAATSMTRFVSVIFPLFFIATEYIYKSKYKYYWCFGLLTLHIVSFYFWLINDALAY